MGVEAKHWEDSTLPVPLLYRYHGIAIMIKRNGEQQMSEPIRLNDVDFEDWDQSCLSLWISGRPGADHAL